MGCFGHGEKGDHHLSCLRWRKPSAGVNQRQAALNSSSSHVREPALIGVDWGTSSCRAYLISRGGQVLEKTIDGPGVLQVAKGAFAKTLADMINGWRQPGLPVVLSGMIGSRQGWIEAPYVHVPARFDQIVAGMVRHPEDPAIHLIPGLAQDLPDQAPDVMRGEETQILGALDDATGRQLLIMPGTHSKWVLIEEGAIVWFATYMTGELFAVLKDHSILGRLMGASDGEEHQSTFIRGLDANRNLPGGLLQQLFSVRTLGLFERLSEAETPAYLSGLLIGHEIEEALTHLGAPTDGMSVAVVGASSLAKRYVGALVHAGLKPFSTGDDVAARGHYHLAMEAGLVSTVKGNMP